MQMFNDIYTVYMFAGPKKLNSLNIKTWLVQKWMTSVQPNRHIARGGDGFKEARESMPFQLMPALANFCHAVI